MTKNRYLEMHDQLGTTPKIEEMPPDWEDFPEMVSEAISTFNCLGDRVYPEIGFIGKDYTNLPHYMRIHKVENEELFLQILLRLETQAVNTSQRRLKAEYDKMKRKGA